MHHSLVALALALGALGLTGPSSPPLPHHPHDIIAATALSPRFPEDPRMFVASPGTINLFMVSSDFGFTWEPSRSGIRGEVFRRIAFASDWTESGLAYLVTEDGGLQVSADFGKTWQPPGGGERLRHLAVPPVGSDGRRALFFASSAILYGSFDNGATHKTIFGWRNVRIESVAVSKTFATDHTVFVGLADGRFMFSGNEGRSWQETRLPASVTFIECSPDFDQDKTVWAATFGAGVFRSVDGGKTFEPCVTGLSDLSVNQVRVVRGETALELFACTKDEGVFHSTDSGASWTLTPLRVQKTNQTENHYTSLALSPTWPADKTVLCGTFEGLNISRDGGATWRESNVNPPRIGRIIRASPTYATDHHLFACGYGMHLLVSPDGGDSWDLRFTGVRAGSVYSVGVSPDYASQPILMLGVFRGIRRSVDGGLNWTKLEFGKYPDEPKDGYTMRAITFAPGFPADRRVFSVANSGLFMKSDDLGETWRSTKVVTPWATNINLSPKFSEDHTLFVSGSGIYVSEDAGETFTGPLHKQHVYGGGLALAPDYPTSGEMYAIMRYDGFMIGSDHGKTWKASSGGLEEYAPMAMSLSPDFARDGTIYVLTSGGGLFRSVDRGRTWQRVTGLGSPVDQGFSLALSPQLATDQTMFVGTYDGFVRSRDGGRHWESITRTELYDDLRDPWERRGTWVHEYRGSPIDQSTSVSTTVGDEISIQFQGIGCRLIGPKGPEFGISMVQLDGGRASFVDQYAETFRDQETLFEGEALKPTSHRLVMRVSGEKRREASGIKAGVDALEVVFR
ncbi:MAG: hypothetical protein HZB39_12330 [Planctomycetes bacterium]|nr:hypothetical protein [Planctomycetota bacterium]